MLLSLLEAYGIIELFKSGKKWQKRNGVTNLQVFGMIFRAIMIFIIATIGLTILNVTNIAGTMINNPIIMLGLFAIIGIAIGKKVTAKNKI